MNLRTTIVAGLSVLSLACGGGSESTGTNGTPTPPTPPAPTTTRVETTEVSMQGTSFTPSAIRVTPGAIVTFTNKDGITHNATFEDVEVPSSGDFLTGKKTIAMPTATGTYGYRCTIHKGMSGSVQVQ